MNFLTFLLMVLATWEVSKVIYPNVIQSIRTEVAELRKHPVVYLEEKPKGAAVAIIPGQKISVNGRIVMQTKHSKEYTANALFGLFYTIVLLVTFNIGVATGNFAYLSGPIGIEACGYMVNHIGGNNSADKWAIRLDAAISAVFLINMIYLTM